MKLSVKERLLLLGSLPQEGNLTSLRLIAKLRLDLSFSEEENKVLKFKSKVGSTPGEGLITWDISKDSLKDIKIGEVARKFIQEAFKQLDEKEKLNLDLLPLYDRFHNKKEK